MSNCTYVLSFWSWYLHAQDKAKLWNKCSNAKYFTFQDCLPLDKNCWKCKTKKKKSTFTVARSLSILGDVCAHWNIYGGFAYVMELIWMSRCFHSSLHSLHLVSPSSKEVAFTKSKDCLWLSVSLQPDGPGAGLSALFLFAKRLYFSCLFMSLSGMRK